MTRLTALLLLVSPACKKASPPETPVQQVDPTDAADAVFERYIEVSGGLEKLRELQRLHVQAESTIQAQNLTMTMHIYQERPDRVLMEVQVPVVGALRRGHADGVAWELNPMIGPRIMEEAEARDMARRNRIDLYEDYAKHFPVREARGVADFNGAQCARIATTTSTGAEEVLYFAVDTGLYMGSEAQIRTDAGEMTITNVIDEYSELDGVLLPVVSRQLIGPLSTLTRLVAVDANPEEFPDLTPPAEVLELAAAPPPATPSNGEPPPAGPTESVPEVPPAPAPE